MSKDYWSVTVVGVYIQLDDLLHELTADGNKVTLTPAKQREVPIFNRRTGEPDGTETVEDEAVLTFHHADGAEDVEGDWESGDLAEIEDNLGRLLGVEAIAHVVDGGRYGFALGWDIESKTLGELRTILEKAKAHGQILGKPPHVVTLSNSDDG